MIDLLALVFYFLPVWIAASWYVFPALRKAISLSIIGLLTIFSACEVMAFFGANFGELNQVLGFFTYIWVFLFWAFFMVLRFKKYAIRHASFIAFLATILATEIWEIPVHALTISMTPTLDQFLITFMLSSPYLILFLPLFYEFWRRTHVLLRTSREFVGRISGFIAVPISLAIVLLWFPLPSWVFQASGYTTGDVNYWFRILWCAVLLLFALDFPEVKEVESGDGHQGP